MQGRRLRIARSGTRAAGSGSGPVNWGAESRSFPPMATGLTYLRARDYSPGTGRFTSRDTLAPNGSGTLAYDPYGYADRNPATFIDPGGHQAMDFARCSTCGPINWAVLGPLVTQALAHAAAAVVEVAANFVRANRWAIVGLMMVAAILVCLASSACHEALPRVIEGTEEIAEGAVEAGVEIVVLVIREIGSMNDPAPEPEPETKQAPEAPLPPAPDPKADREDKDCQLKSFTWWNFAYNLACDTKQNWQTRPYGPPNTQAHHVFPQKFQETFDAILGSGANHQPEFGQWWSTLDPPTHQGSSGAYNVWWARFFNSYRPSRPSYDQTLAFGGTVMGVFHQQVRYPT